MRNMKLYLVYGNTCFEGYGCLISFFGAITKIKRYGLTDKHKENLEE